MTISFPLDYIVGKEIQPQLTDIQRALNELAGVNLSAKEARRVFPSIQEHKWYMSERLGRDVGWRVATIDYFENIEESHSTHSKKESLTYRLRHLVKDLAAIYLTHQYWKAHDGLFVPHSNWAVEERSRHSNTNSLNAN